MKDRKHFREKINIWDFLSFEYIFLLFISILFVIFYYPIEIIKRKKSDRFKKLSKLRVPELCDEIIESNFDDFEGAWDYVKDYKKDYYTKTGLYEHELRVIAKHLSYAATDYTYTGKVLKVAENSSFWVYRNGHEVESARSPTFFYFWFGVIISSLIFYFI